VAKTGLILASTERRGIKQISNAAKWSMQGLHATFKHEASFRLEFYLAIILTPIAVYISHSAMQLFVLITCMVFVLILEIINSSIEAVVDMVCGEKFHDLAKRAKDMGSAAGFLGQLLVIYAWSTIIYINYFE
jgi:diacylglycerol kinase (ATP)